MRRFATVCALVCALTSPALAAGHPAKTDVFAGGTGFAHAVSEGARFDERLGGFRLQDDPAGGYARTGSFTLPSLRYFAGFDRVVPSWNADCPAGTFVVVELGTSPDGGKTWSRWIEAARWGDRETLRFQPAGEVVKADGDVRMNEDTLELKQKADRLRVRVTLRTERPGVTPLVTLLGLAVADKSQEVAADDSPGPAWGKEIKTEFRSQGWEQSDMSYRLCGPTSTTMALTAHGVALPTADVARACWDDANGIYGNWPFIAAAASDLMRRNAQRIPEKSGYRKAFRSWVAWPADWKLVEQEVLAGHPVVVSIRFGKGELKGSPTIASDGHLILVKGFTRDGHPIVHDPAFRAASKGRVVYDRQELHRARHGGPVIVFHPYE